MIALSEPNRDYWQPANLAQALMGIWFAASHQPWVNLHVMLLSLCAYPEWQSILRDELAEKQGLQNYHQLEQLPLLDSFMRETARLKSLDTGQTSPVPAGRSQDDMLTPFSLVAIRRKALVDYIFSVDSQFIPAGSTVCVSSYEASHDPVTFPDPERFNGRRFVDGLSKDHTSRYSDVSENYLIWGYGSLAW
jgi:cytochrome P450